MPTQINFRQFLNTLTIGILTEVVLVLWLYCLGYLDIKVITGEKTVGLSISLAIIFASPFWRLISNQVGFLLEPNTDHSKDRIINKIFGKVRFYYRKLFFGENPNMESVEKIILKKIFGADEKSIENKIKNKIISYFGLENVQIGDKDFDTLFEMMKSTANNSTFFTSSISEIHNISTNFHSRLAIVCNVGFWASIHLIFFGQQLYLKYPFNPYISFSIMFFILGKHFAIKCSKSLKEGCWLKVIDFISCIDVKSSKNA